MVRALAGDSTITRRVPWPLPFAAAPFPLVAAPLSPLSEAAAVLLAALLLAGTLFTNLTSAPWPVTLRRARRHAPTRRPPQVPYAASPRNARPCRYPCTPVSRPYCSRRALRHIRITSIRGRKLPAPACALRERKHN